MDNLSYALLGLLQGVTEPIPVSSSGHLRLFLEIFKIKSTDLNFEIIVNFGSLLAILFIFRKDIIKLIKNFFNYLLKKDKKYLPDFKYSLLKEIHYIINCVYINN